MTSAAGYLLDGAGLVDREVDVLVLGGGVAGSFAAMAAREAGASVVLVESSNVLGGQGTAGGVAGFVGDTARVNAAFAELIARLGEAGAIEPYRPNDDRRAYDLEICAFILQEMLVARGVELWLHARALHAHREGGQVSEVLVVVGPTLIRVRPRIVVDATGNAIVPHMLGCRTVSLGALKQLPMSLYFTLWDTGHAVRPWLPPGCPRWEGNEDLPMTSLHPFGNGKIEVKMKVVGFDAADGVSLAQAEIHARRQMMGLVYHLQTRGYGGRHAAGGGKPLARHALASVSRAIGQREGRRIVGKHTLAEAEITRGAVFDDAVAVGTYHLDFHWPDTERRAGTGITTMVEPYHIPLRAMLPEALDNVLCPGRALSGDQMALSSYRAMATCVQMGWGAGRAAGMSLNEATPLTALDMPRLCSVLEVDGQSLDLSAYGDYLRCLRLTDETPGAPHGAQTARANRAISLALCRGRDSRVFVLTAASDDPATLHVTMRFEGAWHALPDIVCTHKPGTLRAAAVAQDGRIVVTGADGSISFAPGGAVATRTETQRDAGPVRTADGLQARVEPANGGTLIALLSTDGGVSWDRSLLVAEDADPDVTPAVIATPVGLAIVHARCDGSLRYWEGSVERFAPSGGTPPTEAELQRMPYLDHVILPTKHG